MTGQLTGGGSGPSVMVRLRAGLKDAVVAYAASRRASVNLIMNEAVTEYLTAKGQEWVDEVGTVGAGEKA